MWIFPEAMTYLPSACHLTDRLAKLLNRKVDVVPEHEFNRHIRENVLREAVEL